MFFDEVSLELIGGRGGDGAVSFHREKFIAYGPPDGGNGGCGGDVILVADPNKNTLRHFAGKKKFKAEKGQNGSKNNKSGKNGESLELSVPIGSVVFDRDSGEKLGDLDSPGKRIKVSGGGRGGRGNAGFVSSVRQVPKFAEIGDVGEYKFIRLEMQLVADVGLVGFPSSGKSTLISHVSAAKPKIADYPFTTLIPNLGVVNLSEFGGNKEQSFVIADMPGIIEGASKGKGLGDKFLKHISRSVILVFLLDPFSYQDRSLGEQFRVLSKELSAYREDLLEKGQLVVMNKIDAVPEEDRGALKEEFLKEFPGLKDKFRMISGFSGEKLPDLMKELWRMVDDANANFNTNVNADKLYDQTDEVFDMNGEEGSEDEEIHDYKAKYFVDDLSFNIEEMYDVRSDSFDEKVWGKNINDETLPKRKLFKVEGERIEQISRMSDFSQEGALQRIYDVMKKMGIRDELRRAGAKTGDYVKIEPHFFEFHDVKNQ